MKNIAFGKLFVFAVVLFCGASLNVRAETFTAYIDSAQEVPANPSNATAYGRVFLDETAGTISFTVVFSGLSSNQVGAHIHAPGTIGVNGPVIISLGAPGGTSNTIIGNSPITPAQIAVLRTHQAYINIHSVDFPGGEIRGQLAPKRPVDYDGDGKTDYSVLRFPGGACPGPTLQITYWNRSSSGPAANQTIPWGDACTDFPAPGDYDGDGKDDISVYRAGASAGEQSFFLILRSMDNTAQFVPWGIFGDLAVARDYDGDGITDVSVFRPGGDAAASTTWYILPSSDGMTRIESFGLTGNGISAFDTPIPGDYDGDGKFDIAVYRFGQTPSNNYIVRHSSNGAVTYKQWGNFNTDWIVPGDYDGDGKFEIAAARVSGSGTSPMVWWILRSSDNQVSARQFGSSSDFPTQGDYDGDGVTDISVWRSNADGAGNSAFYTAGSFGNTFIAVGWGQAGDFSVNTFDSR